MSYATFSFIVFFVIVYIAYYTVRTSNSQVLILIGSSGVFYAWEAPNLTILFVVSWLLTATSVYAVQQSKTAITKKQFAVLGVLLNLSTLCFFKYKGLFWESAGGHDQLQLTVTSFLLTLPLPIGISFYTFHSISLVVDVYSKRFDSKTFLGESAIQSYKNILLYLIFFPQLVAGPIIKAKDFFPQLTYKRSADVNFTLAFRTLIIGYFLKVFVADNLAEQTSSISYPYFLWRSSGELAVLLVGYSAQIFADFSGYSLIAIGLAELLGYKLPQNFNYPYLSESLTEFWRRWHISLSSWLRDYLYIPLGGSRAPPIRVYANLLIVMFLGGLWHGAAWSFAVWGLWHGIGLMFERGFRGHRIVSVSQGSLFIRALKVIVVFSYVTLGWLLFRLQEFQHAAMYLIRMISFQGELMPNTNMVMICFYSAIVFFYHALSIVRTSERFKDSCRACMAGLILLGGGPSAPFIYFQF